MRLYKFNLNSFIKQTFHKYTKITYLNENKILKSKFDQIIFRF